ncbi:MAG: type I-C CRISPR-associated endonuclease Cas1c [Anaerovoracaceae bacterium]|nr:type I-C CRISPR-associated endonuclease Cas1c [Anaerovoracaceae bacterium]
MRRLLNTLYVTTEDAYLTLDGDNIVIRQVDSELSRFPLHMLESIIAFTYAGASPALMGECAKRNIGLTFCTPRGRFLARAVGESSGNVLLRRTQYRVADDLEESCRIAKSMIFGKIYNSRWSIERTIRDHGLRLNVEELRNSSSILKNAMQNVMECENLETLRGIEGEAASVYFSVLDNMILTNKDVFQFSGRNRRPPMDNINAMLSFIYALLANDCTSALESVGLDSYVGFLHRDRPGRNSLSLDLMEELRSCYGDRFVITLVNNRVVNEFCFEKRENGSVMMLEDGRKKVIKLWQEKKREEITHPFLKEKISWGLVPHVQALLLARYLRGDLDAYPPFLWK